MRPAPVEGLAARTYPGQVGQQAGHSNVPAIASSSVPASAGKPLQPSGDGRVGPWTARLLVANVVAQVAIVLTGGLVRLTGSGLGCPTWPECTGDSFVPVAGQPQGFHTLIEFGNRSLTGVLVLVAIAALVAVSRNAFTRAGRSRTRPALVVLAAVVVLGIVAQAILGGVTVLLGLNPAVVAAHLLLSMVLIAVAFVLAVRAREPGDQPVEVLVRPELRWLARAIVVTTAVVLAVGTVVTGSGPRSGDARALVRFDVDPRVVSWLHADVVLVLLGLTLALWLGVRLTGAVRQVGSRATLLLVAVVVQAAVGYSQYFSGLPVPLVAVHLLGACLVWLSAWWLLLGTRRRGTATADRPPLDVLVAQDQARRNGSSPTTANSTVR